MWAATSSWSLSSHANASSGACWNTSGTTPTANTKTSMTSAAFADKDYAILACPQRMADNYCEGNKFSWHNDDDGQAITLKADFANVMSCGWTYVVFCGAPTIKVALTGATASDVEFTTMEYALDSTFIDATDTRLTTATSATTYSLPTWGSMFYQLPPTVTATYFNAVDKTADAGAWAKTYGGSTAAATK